MDALRKGGRPPWDTQFLELDGLHLVAAKKMGRLGVVSAKIEADAEQSASVSTSGPDGGEAPALRMRGHGREEPHLSCPSISMK
jgi:hypothetical protein